MPDDEQEASLREIREEDAPDPERKSPKKQYAADLAEKYGDTATQDVVKKTQYPYATDFWKGPGWSKGNTDPSLYPSEARQQRYRTQDERLKRARRKRAGKR